MKRRAMIIGLLALQVLLMGSAFVGGRMLGEQNQHNIRRPGGGQSQLQVQDAALSDVKVGNTIMVWGTKNGQRVTAEVIYIQSAGR